MQQIVPEIERTAKLIQEITAASIEQNSGAEQINNAVQQLTQVIQVNANVGEQLSNNAQAMSTQAERLKEIISFFKIDNVVHRQIASIVTKKEATPIKKKYIPPAKPKKEMFVPTQGINLRMEESDDEFTRY